MRPIRNRAKPPLCGRAPSARRAALGPAPASRSLVGAALPLTQAHSPGLDTWALRDPSAHSARFPASRRGVQQNRGQGLQARQDGASDQRPGGQPGCAIWWGAACTCLPL